MASAYPLSVPGENSSLQLFQVPVTDVSIVKSKWVDYEPVQSGTNPIEFVIKPLSDYIDINKTELRLVIMITKKMEETLHLERSTLFILIFARL